MTYSQYQFLPLQVKGNDKSKYRLLKFTDARDPRHQHLYDVSGSMIENWESQNNKNNKEPNAGRLLELNDNWCLLPNNITESKGWKEAPYPHRGHPVLYIPGHWGSFSQARSIGAHGTRWTGRSLHGKGLHDIYESFLSGRGMHDGRNLNAPKTVDQFMDWYHSSYSLSNLSEFVMDVYSLDYNEEGAALHPSRLLRQAEFFAMAIETMVDGCHLGDSGVTIVAHSIGAWVVRIALKIHPHLAERGWIKNVITLASPLGGVPYAVDAGVHDLVSHLNDDDGNIGSVTFISVSGGLRDEMIPPKACEIPFSTKDVTKSNTEAFLATTVLNRNVKNTKYQYGMDHRAIVWCFDLLKVVREVIFSLAVTSDQDMTPPNRMNVARRVMLGKHIENQTSFQKDVDRQQDLLLTEKGYMKAAAIQLASPYHLNSLLKLAISVLLLDLHVLTPVSHYLSPATSSSSDLYFTILQRSTNTLILVPLLITAMFTIRRSLVCVNNECSMLLGTVFVLVQLATAISMLICLIAAGIRKCFTLRTRKTSSTKIRVRDSTFGSIVFHITWNHLRHLLFIALPFVAGSTYAFYHFSGASDFVWDEMSIASCCFISILALQLLIIVQSLINSSDWRLNSECKTVLVFLLATIKSTHGAVLYAVSLGNQAEQIDSSSYDGFLAANKSNSGMAFGRHNELILCIAAKVVPTLLAINAVRAYETMRLQFDIKNNKKNNGIEAVQVNAPERYRSLSTVATSLSLWYTLNVFSSTSQDELLIPAYATFILISYYMNSIPFSSAAQDIYSVIAENDLSLCCTVAKDHNKKE